MNLVTLEGNLRDKYGFNISYRDVLSSAMYPKVPQRCLGRALHQKVFVLS